MGGADILVNCAGFTAPFPMLIWRRWTTRPSIVSWPSTPEPPFSAVRAFAPQLRASGDGLVVQLSSIAATTAVGSCIAYCAPRPGWT